MVNELIINIDGVMTKWSRALVEVSDVDTHKNADEEMLTLFKTKWLDMIGKDETEGRTDEDRKRAFYQNELKRELRTKVLEKTKV